MFNWSRRRKGVCVCASCQEHRGKMCPGTSSVNWRGPVTVRDWSLVWTEDPLIPSVPRTRLGGGLHESCGKVISFHLPRGRPVMEKNTFRNVNFFKKKFVKWCSKGTDTDLAADTEVAVSNELWTLFTLVLLVLQVHVEHAHSHTRECDKVTEQLPFVSCKRKMTKEKKRNAKNNIKSIKQILLSIYIVIFNNCYK